MTQENQAKDQALAQAESIVRLVAALECDYDRLEEMRDEMEELDDAILDAFDDEEVKDANDAKAQWLVDNKEEFDELVDNAGEYESQDDARQAIEEDPLSVEVRSDWYTPGSEDNKPSEFMILLCTGGPAVRIMGELNEYSEPCRAWIEYQDWGTSWTHLCNAPIEQSTLLTYCQCFYFGE